MAILGVQNLTFRLNGQNLLEEIFFQIERGEKIALVGRNGAGKSTLLKMLSGELAPDSGLITPQKGAKISRLPQEVPQNLHGTVREIVAGGDQTGQVPEYEIEATISRLGLDGDALFEQLSGGLKRRAFLGRVLMDSPDLLLLDEPTNHLDIESIAFLEEFLRRYPKSLLFVSHDREFMRALSTRILEIDRGQLRSFECSYDEYLNRKEGLLEAEAKNRADFEKKMAIEDAYSKRTVEARRTKSQSRLRKLDEMRREKSEWRSQIGSGKIVAQNANLSGRLVVEASAMSFAFGEKKIVENFSTLILRGDKIGIIGPNGSGKTTLLKLLLGELEPQNGEIRLGTNLEIAYSDQLRGGLDESKTVRWNVAGENDTVLFGGQHRHIIGYLQDFLFTSDRANSPVSVLSGGERNRLLLAKLLTKPANLLVMDEPTNDLDIETLDLLENLLVDFPGTVLLVSHDRAFLNGVANSTLVLEGEGKIAEYPGGYDDYLRQKPRETVIEKPKTAAMASMTKPKTRKLSFKETRELEELPAQIEKLEAEQTALGEQILLPEFYSSATKMADAAARLKAIEAELERAFARWEELEEKGKL